MLSLNEFHLGRAFSASAAKHPNQAALRLGDKSWSYGELHATASTWAAAMLANTPNLRRVGIFAYRSATAYAGILAAVLANATYVPLNKTFPLARTRTMVELAGLDAVIVDAASMPQLAAILADLPRPPLVLAPDVSTCHGVTGRILCRDDLKPGQRVQNLTPSTVEPAYLLFTSGSTGQPKGVPITHANLGHFLAVNSARYGLRSDDNLSQTFDHTFDLAAFDMFLAWMHGACVCVPQPVQLLAPYQFVRDANVTVWFSVPSVANILRKKGSLVPNSMPSLRWSLFCGEALPLASAQAWAAAAPQSVVENLYGPTELTIACGVYRFDAQKTPAACVNGLVPIGRLYPGLHGLLVDAKLDPIPKGEAGELCVAGPQNFSGYWNDVAKTESAHLQHTGPDGITRRYYRTGDRVRETSGGDIVFIGRVDQQLKIMGYRVEIGDIEAVMRQHPGVTEAVAVGWPTTADGCSGVVGFATGRNVQASALLARIRAALPPYMVPRTVHILDKLPINSNGKIDRNALQASLEGRNHEQRI